jgi:predicted O-linked N-acetylglucosamine transferase (SPINDLY family)
VANVRDDVGIIWNALRTGQWAAVAQRAVPTDSTGAWSAAAIRLARALQAQHDPALAAWIAAQPTPPAKGVLADALVALLARRSAWGSIVEALGDDPRVGERSPLRVRALAGALMGLGRLRDAASLTAGALEREPGDLDLAVRHAGACRWLLRPHDAAAALRRCAQRQSAANPGAWAALAQQLNYDPQATPEEHIAAHTAFGDTLSTLAQPFRLPPIAHGAMPNPARPIRLGFISSDLRTHSVCFFLEPLLEELAKFAPVRFELFAYSTGPHSDDTTARLRRLVPRWRDAANLDARALAQAVRSDAIDVAVELNGPADGSRLSALALRPAPIQATYLGYPATTGLPAIDLRLVDAHTDPPGSERFCRERLARIEGCFLCYRPPADSPHPASVPPSVRTGRVTFGCFNQVFKLNTPLLAWWGRILAGVPGSHLMIKGAGAAQPETRGAILDALAPAGISPDRVETLDWAADTRQHLALYGTVDVALDTFPYHGTTTTCEALWMGVPVVTLAGTLHAGRVGVSLLHAAGVPEWIAESPEAYIALAQRLALDEPARTRWRAEARASLTASTLLNAPAHAARFAAAVMGAVRPVV